MSERDLFHMYQAWLQGNENYIRDWADFVEWAARWHQTSGDEVMRVLQRTHWFKWGDQ